MLVCSSFVWEPKDFDTRVDVYCGAAAVRRELCFEQALAVKNTDFLLVS